MLSCRVGVQYIEAIEDAVQSALIAALDTWTVGLPDNPSAWLFRVAQNNVMGELRQRTRRRRILEQKSQTKRPINTESGPEVSFAGEVRDDPLRMLFVCCDPIIPVESQLALALKTLCGFDIREIALRLFTSERLPDLTGEQYSSRLSAVHHVLYLLFTEGYLSSHAEMAIRKELCSEALRLVGILAEHSVGPDAGNVCFDGPDAPARGAHDNSPERIRWFAPAGGARPKPLGPAEDSSWTGVAGQIRPRKSLFPVPRGSWDRGGTLPCSLVFGDALGQGRGVLLSLGAHLALRTP